MALSTTVGLEFVARDRSRAGMMSFQRNIGSITNSALRLAGLTGGIYLVQRAFRGLLEVTKIQERAETDLRAAVGGNIDEYKKYAAQLQRLTVYGDEQILSEMAYAANLGVTTDKLEAAAKAAIGLAAKYRIDLRSAMMLVGRASQGQTQLLTRYGIVLDDSLTPQEKFNALLKIGADNFGLAEAQAHDASGTTEQFKNAMGDLGEKLGGLVLPAMTKVTRAILDGAEAIGKYNEKTKTAISQQEEIRKWTTGSWGFNLQQMAEISGRAQNLPIGRIEFGPGRLEYIEQMKKRAAELQAEANKTSEAGMVLAKEQIAAEKAAQKQALQDTREYVQSVRHMDYLTRMERIQNLEDYRAAHQEIMYDVTGAETEAGKAIRQEIEAVKNSRLDAMKVYAAELREDMQNTSLYISERFAEASRSIESSLSSSFQSMMRDGTSFRDAMIQFLTDIENAFIKMAADMAARAAAASILNPIMGGLVSIFTGGGSPNYAPNFRTDYSNAGVPPVLSVTRHHGGAAAWTGPMRLVSPDIFADAPKFHDLNPGEVAVIAERGEEISRPGTNKNQSPPNVIVNNYTGQNFQTDGPASFDGQNWVIGIVAKNIKEGGTLKRMMRR